MSETKRDPCPYCGAPDAMGGGDRPTTVDEIAALPIGPAFGTRTENGITRAVAPAVVAVYSEPDDITGYVDQDDQAWRLGRYADGSWFRSRV